MLFVPNAPCGVERYLKALKEKGLIEFLMHRVELKDLTTTTTASINIKFLMHRVELKA